MGTATRTRPGRPGRIMRELAASPGGLSTPQLVDALGEGIPVRQRALTWYGAILRLHARAGHVEKTGRTPGAWQQGPAVIWRITPAGHQWLRGQDERAGASSRQERARAERARHAEATAVLLKRALTVPVTSRGERMEIARELRDAGCSLAQIGLVFGISREMVRLDLLPDGQYEAILDARRAACQPASGGKSRKGGRPTSRARVAEEIARAIEQSVCEPGEQCADRFCADCVRCQQAQEDAATARRVGGAG